MHPLSAEMTQSIVIDLIIKRPWGTANTSATACNILHSEKERQQINHSGIYVLALTLTHSLSRSPLSRSLSLLPPIKLLASK